MNLGAISSNKRGAERQEPGRMGWHAVDAAFGELTPAEAEHFQEQTLAAWVADSPALADRVAKHSSHRP